MVKTIAIHGSSGEVMAPIAGHPGEFMTGKPRIISVTGLGTDESDPLIVREALVGVEVRTMFDRSYLGKNFYEVVPEGALVAFIEDTVEALRNAGKTEAADLLWEETAEKEPLAMYVFQPGIFELLGVRSESDLRRSDMYRHLYELEGGNTEEGRGDHVGAYPIDYNT